MHIPTGLRPQASGMGSPPGSNGGGEGAGGPGSGMGPGVSAPPPAGSLAAPPAGAAAAGAPPAAASPAPALPAAMSVEGGDAVLHLMPQPVLGKLFVRMLKYYADEFRPAETVLSAVGPCYRGGTNPNNAASGGHAAALAAGIVDPLTIVDPLDPSNNVGRNCFRFFQVQQAFREACRALAQYAAANPTPPQSVADFNADSLAGPSANGSSGSGGGAGSSHEFPLLSVILPALRNM
jgi:hypothetical protein